VARVPSQLAGSRELAFDSLAISSKSCMAATMVIA